MKKLINVFLLSFLTFNGCDVLDDLEECNDLTEAYNTSSTAFSNSPSRTTCEQLADDLLPLIENDCQLNLSGSGYEDWTVADVDSFKTEACPLFDL